MTSFEDLFFASRGQPVEYEGQTIQLGDTVPLSGAGSIRIVRESSGARWRQGVYLSTKGHFIVNGEVLPNAIVLWRDTAPETVHVGINSNSGVLYVKNVWDTGDGTMHSWHNGAAMIVTQIDDVRHYRCSDGEPNASFDDLVFRLELNAASLP